MFEKFKDLLYEVSDLLLALIIILFMSTVITWKVTDSLAYSKTKNTKVESIKNEQSSDTTIQNTSVDGQKKDSPTKDHSEKVSTLHITIPNGTFGIGIAQILKENGLIDDPQKFIHRVTELGMDAKLKSGQFNIPSNSSLDAIIYIIIGTKK